MTPNKPSPNRRDFLKSAARNLCFLSTGAISGYLMGKQPARKTYWQIDPLTCTACGNCATYCVLKESAVKVVHNHALCGYCDLCTGYFMPTAPERDTGAENLLCPTGAITRTFVVEPYFEYNVDEKLCTGCGKCVKGCTAFGNGSLFLQILQDRCLQCNECSIAAACPAQAIHRVPADKPYKIKDKIYKHDET